MASTAAPSVTGPDSAPKHPKRLLPPALSSATPHGPINKPARSAGEEAALDKRKNEILQSMNKEQIDAAYSGQAVKINEHLQRKAKKNDEIDSKLALLSKEHEMEMRVIKASLTRQNEDREAEAEEVMGEKGREEGNGREEGEVEMTG